MDISRWRKPPEPDPKRFPPRTGGGGCSPKITLVVFNAAAIQELDVLLLKGPMTMMLLLSNDVVANLFALGCAHGECAVALLPLEARSLHLVVNSA